jgi:thiamine biosynthesis lipoprotein
MDTYINVVIYSNNTQKVNEAFEYIDELYSDYHRLTDRYLEYDEMYNAYYINNNLEMNEELVVDERLFNVIEYGYDNFLSTDGNINIAMGNVVDVWKEYRDSGTGIPTIDELNVNTNINDLVLNSEKNSVMKTGNISLDLGAISKGYVTELASEYLESVGLNEYLISAGGNVVVGDHYKNQSYRVGIEKPISGSTELYKVVNVTNKAVVTSGGYHRFYEYEGNIYHHIIDSETNYPPTNMLSVTVICDDSGYADILSTYLFLMDIESGFEYVNSLQGVEAVWYGLDNEVYTSLGFGYYE